MKSERRHDLETNELVVWLEKFRPYAGQATAVVAVLVAMLAIRTIWMSDSAAKQEAAWDAFAMAQDTTDPELMSVLEVAENSAYQNTTMPEWAYATWADRQLLLANQAYLADRNAALSRTEKIEGIYRNLIDSANDAEVRNRARFGLACVYELQNKLDEAKQQYAAVQGDLVGLASERAAHLDSPEVQESLTWLATAELPKPSASNLPGGRPSFDAEMPSTEGGELDTQTLENLLQNLTKETAPTEKRYGEGEEATEGAEENSEAAEPATEEAAPSEEPAADGSESDSEPAAEAEEPAAETEAADATEGQ